MLSLAYRPAAVADLDAIFDFIGADNPARALTFVDQVRGQIRKLCAYPQLGPAREDLGQGIRIFPMLGRVVVAYRVQPEAIEVVRVFYGGQDYQSLQGE